VCDGISSGELLGRRSNGCGGLDIVKSTTLWVCDGNSVSSDDGSVNGDTEGSSVVRSIRNGCVPIK
jgi:hypothetical protein